MAQKGMKTLLIDLDPQGNSTMSYLDRRTVEKSMFDVLTDPEVKLKDVIRPSGMKNLDIAPARISLAKIESKLLGEIDGHFRLRDKIDAVRRSYDAVLIDTPPTLGMITVNAMVASSHVLIPIQSSYFALEGTDDLLETIDKIKARPNPEPPDPGRRHHAARQADGARQGRLQADRRGLRREDLQDHDLQERAPRGEPRAPGVDLHLRAALERAPPSTTPSPRRCFPVSKTPRPARSESHMRHDSHFVDSLSERFGPSLGRWIPIEEIETNPDQPRRSVGDLDELKKSIESKGVLEPHPRPAAAPTGGSGSSRGSAASARRSRPGSTEVPCIELDVPDNEVMEIALIENLHRARPPSRSRRPTGYATLAETPRLHAAADRDAIGKSRVSITEAMSLLEIPEDLREKCRRADIDARSVLLEIARLGDRREDGGGDRRASRGLDARRPARAEEGEAGEPDNVKRRAFHFVYSPKDGPFKLNISFHKSRVAKAELIDALRGVLKQLESGELELTKK